MVSDEKVAKLRATGAAIHIVGEKCSIASYAPIKNPATQKLLCINPDFVDWHFAAEECQAVAGLRAIISSSDNISWLDTDYADHHGISYEALENLTSEYSAVAEYAIAIMTSLARQIPLLARNQFPLDYAHDFVKYQGIDIAGKTAGIIGLGNIGGAIAKLCAGLGMKVIYWSRSKKAGEEYEYREIDAIVREADVIFPTLQPNDETKRLLPNEGLALMKAEAILVSVVGGLVDTNYLAKRTADKKLFGVGFGADPNTFNDYSGNVWAVPDYAWATKGNMQTSYDQFVAKIVEAAAALAAEVG